MIRGGLHAWRALAVTGLVLLAGVAPHAAAQQVRGTVVHADGATPAVGVLLELLDDAGVVRTRATSGASGRFTLPAPGTGRFVVRALRIGYRPTASVPLEVGPAGAELRLTLGDDRVTLDAIRVEARTTCRPVAGGGADLVTVWEEARKALAYASVTAAGRRHRLLVATFERVLERDPTGDDLVIGREEQRRAETREVRAFRSVDLDTLLAEGFVVERDGALHFFGPDADVLLAPRFVAAHCLRIVPDPQGNPARIAIAFEPAGRRDVIGVRGTLTLDRSTGELQQLRFGYVGLPDEAATAGGELSFTRIDDVGWVVQRWQLRMPVLDVETGGRPGGRDARVSVRQLRATGGELLEVLLDDRTLHRTTLRRVSGRVLQDDGSTPAVGAQVTLEGTTHAVATDSMGTFVLDAVLPGRYRLAARTPALDSLGARAPGGIVDLSHVDATDRDMRLPDAETMYRTLCRVERDDRRGALLRLTVRDAGSGRGIGGAAVRLRWGGIERDGRVLGRQQERALVTEDDGTLAWCGAPRGVELRLQVTVGDAVSPEQRFTISPLRPLAVREVRITPR